MSKPTEVPIHIDRKPFKLESPATGVALYEAGSVPQGYDLFREVHGPGDDEPIVRDASPVVLHPGDHFYSAQSTLNPGANHG